jgi:hypothetical protein
LAVFAVAVAGVFVLVPMSLGDLTLRPNEGSNSTRDLAHE